MDRPKLRERLSVVAFCVCPVVWLLGMVTLCHCPRIWVTAGAIALVPVVLGATRVHQLMGMLFLIFSVGMAVGEFKAYARERTAVERIRTTAMEQSTRSAATAPSATQP